MTWPPLLLLALVCAVGAAARPSSDVLTMGFSAATVGAQLVPSVAAELVEKRAHGDGLHSLRFAGAGEQVGAGLAAFARQQDGRVVRLPDGRWLVVRTEPESGAWNGSGWMGQLYELGLGQLTLLDVVLPGTHDSGTFGLDPTQFAVPRPHDVDEATLLCREIERRSGDQAVNCSDVDAVAAAVAYPWAVTQRHNWTAQLERGARSLDYRGYYDRQTGRWQIEHTLAGYADKTGPAVLGAQARAFLEANAGEIIIIEYCNYNGNGNASELLAQFSAALGGYAYAWNAGTSLPGNPSIAAMLQQNMRAVLVACNSGYGPVASGIQNDYPDSCTLADILAYDGAEMASFAAQPPAVMRKLGFQVTADGDCIVDGVVGAATLDRDRCTQRYGFRCSPDLLGYIDQLNAHFTFDYVAASYFNATPTPSYYFGNVWNFDNTQPLLNYIVASLNLMVISAHSID